MGGKGRLKHQQLPGQMNTISLSVSAIDRYADLPPGSQATGVRMHTLKTNSTLFQWNYFSHLFSRQYELPLLSKNAFDSTPPARHFSAFLLP